jgi:uncharacterized protein (DUF1810 family)
MSLERFHEAQLRSRTGYETALAEIRAGGKRSHWIWYIFPQIEGLGLSSMARAYALRDLGEASAYLRDPILRGRYEEIAGAVSEQLSRGISIKDPDGQPNRRSETGVKPDPFPRRRRTTGGKRCYFRVAGGTVVRFARTSLQARLSGVRFHSCPDLDEQPRMR